MVRLVKKRLGKLLVEKKVITNSQLEEALKKQRINGGFLGQILFKLGYATEEEIVSCLATQYGIPYLPLENYEIESSVVKLIPEEIARHHYLIPIDKIGNILTVAMADPLSEVAIKAVEEQTQLKMERFVSTGTEIDMAINQYYNPSGKDRKGDVMTEANFHLLTEGKGGKVTEEETE